MISLKTIVLSLFGLFIASKIAIMVLDDVGGLQRNLSESKARKKKSKSTYSDLSDPSTIKTELDAPTYRFTDPTLAYGVLSHLDVFEPVDVSYLKHGPNPKDQYEKPFMGLKNDAEYCKKHRAYFVENPDMVFRQKNFVFQVGPSNMLRYIAADLGNDVMPHIGVQMNEEEKKKPVYDLNLNTNLFFFIFGVQRYKHVGKDFACLSQEFNHIPGHYSLNRKDTIAEGAANYQKKYQSRPQCFSYDKYFPKTWLLYQEDSCKDFFQEFNSQEYLKAKEEKKVVYIKKVAVGSHRGQGVTPVSDTQEVVLRDDYKNGSLCGSKTKPLEIVQNYVHNPLLLQGRKFDFRMYMVIASANPLMVFYHDGFLRVSLYEYNADADDKKVLLTNLALNHEVYSDAKKGLLENGTTEEDLKIAQQWSFERLEKYLQAEKVVNDSNWLENYLRPEFKKAMIHLVRMSSHTFLKRSSLYELYGVDFMLDTDLTLWFLEANSGPALGGYSEPMHLFITKMIQDQFELAFGLLRSRMKRVVILVNKIIAENQAVADDKGEVQIKNYNSWKEEFDKVSMNYYEPEYAPSPTNGFSKIIDENYSGAERYMGLIDNSCL